MNAAPMQILVVDDNLDTARMMKILLKRQGHAVKLAHDGPEAIAAAREARPDVVLLDLALPTMSGFEVAATLREAGGFESTAIVAVSGYGMEREGSDLFDGHFMKPLNHDALKNFLAGLPAARKESPTLAATA